MADSPRGVERGHATGRGVSTVLWLAVGVWMAARLTTLGLRAHGRTWLVTGAARP